MQATDLRSALWGNWLRDGAPVMPELEVTELSEAAHQEVPQVGLAARPGRGAVAAEHQRTNHAKRTDHVCSLAEKVVLP